MQPGSARIFTREFVIISISTFLFSNNFYTLLTQLPSYAMSELGLSEGGAGVATGLYVVGMLGSRFFSGRLVTRTGFRPMYTVGLVGIVVFTAASLFVATPAALYAVRVCAGVAYGMTANTAITMASTIIPQKRSGEGVGYYSMFQLVAWAVGPFTGAQLSANGSFAGVFVFCTILPLVSLACVPFLRMSVFDNIKKPAKLPPPAPGVDALLAPEDEKLLDKFFERTVLPVAASCVLLFLFNSSMLSFESVFAQSVGLSEIASYFFLVYVAALLAMRPFVSRLIDRRGANFVLFPCCAIYVAGFAVFAMMKNSAMLVIAAILFGVGFGAVQNAMLALTVRRAPRHRFGMANATFYMSLDLCASIGPMIAGLLVPLAGYRGLYLIAAVCTAAGLPVYYRLVGKDPSARTGH
ncbi:MAG: MFS transporter [Clostridiales Family XIII bacterium]|jgi:MFS family permease|nr:MFS transporter [Clostridiales Family XIII bacterium]